MSTQTDSTELEQRLLTPRGYNDPTYKISCSLCIWPCIGNKEFERNAHFRFYVYKNTYIHMYCGLVLMIYTIGGNHYVRLELLKKKSLIRCSLNLAAVHI